MEEKVIYKKDDFDDLPEVRLEPAFMENIKPATDYLDTFYNELGSGEEYLGLRTGIDKLDNKTLGLRGLIVLAGSPGAGKTSFALQLAFGVCEHLTPVIFYSLEQTRKQILSIILSQISGISGKDIMLQGKALIDDKIGNFTPEERQVLKTAKESIENKLDSFYIRSYEEDQPGISLDILEEEIKGIQLRHGKKVLVIVDQVQDLDLKLQDKDKPDLGYRDQIDKEGQIIRGLSKIVNKTGACILGVSHLNKTSVKENTTGKETVKKPSLHGIKGSVDLIYKPESVWGLYSPSDDNDKDKTRDVNLVIMKARDYALGDIEFKFNKKTKKFDIQ
jgi:replicative DNA helicase